ncbi:crotonase/enoyl-CoA hydratase family protein [Rhodococcus artemisiae]|uniref:Crotonase/enoyl-CoA hydratase family protein n=1 Tax=Rhodococcus artemisiae TaxID=714159 RepID=A0ABU7LL71_9NOCA|nr:crotonase/enoyl-CoA hydratase family protein [Rhodococcus artemisiae]MEE2062315.1 crotonase/enoyl-CoA hydratase family protein [Rhodococcus artemisiae]
MSDEAAAPVVLTERVGPVLVITLNRPQARNAVDREVAQAVAAAVDLLDSDPGLRVGVLTGSGGNFCAGMDLKSFLRGESPRVEGRGFAGLVEAPPSKPLIAAVEGNALAGGFEIVLAADLIVAAPTATFGLPEVRRGLVAAAGGLTRLPARLPRAIALEMVLTGKAMTAAQLHPLGLINRLAPESAVLTAAIELAEEIAANGPLAIQASKRVVDESPTWPAAEHFERTRQIAMPVFGSNDAREGAAAFTERRTAVWTAT